MIHQISNTIQKYAWGDPVRIAELLGVPNDDKEPFAELWMGAHPKASSVLMNDKKNIFLFDYIQNEGATVLGQGVKQKFDQLPFLFKILSAGSPLSIQAHPNLAQAKAGFLRENQKGIPLDAFNRSYKDANHKPETICAVTEFKAMNGFRPKKEIREHFQPIANGACGKILDALNDQKQNSYEMILQMILGNDDLWKSKALSEVLDYAAKEKNHEAFQTVLNLHHFYPGDASVLFPLILNLITLQPGQSMFLKAGQLHSYMSGLGVELMANSDNVLRGGLTPKFIDIAELMSVLAFEETCVSVEEAQGPGAEKFFPVHVDEFRLSKINVADSVVIKKPGVSIMICLEGRGNLRSSGQSLAFKKGFVFFVSDACEEVLFEGQGLFYRATVPQ